MGSEEKLVPSPNPHKFSEFLLMEGWIGVGKTGSSQGKEGKPVAEGHS